MKSLVWACLALVACPTALAVYFTTVKEVFKPPADRHLRNNSYFGYSITYDEYNKKLIISSPRENDIGEVYNCDIPTHSCNAIPRNIPRISSNYTHDYWFGATVKAGRDFVLMCAPRFTDHTIRKSDNTGFNAEVTQGKCYALKSDGKLLESRIITESERNADSPSPMESTMDSFGWSIDVASNDNVMVGGPGMFHGRAMIYDRFDKVPKLIRKAQTTPTFNFGYAVAAGTFVNRDLSFAIGSTYGKHGVGEVHFYKGLTYLLKLDKVEDREDVGSMFGAVLCAANLHGKRTDLLVGAPTYATKNTYNRGAVYVYLALKMTKSPIFKRKIVGEFSGAMFGSAIVNVGDLNNDGKHEIAIGAPFEKDGTGVVYLYSGADLISELTDKTLKPLQKIEPEASYGESFGMSLTPLLDYDANGCKELAIGSPYKDSVLLLRCMASVTVGTVVTFPDLQYRTKESRTNFQFTVCLHVTYPSLPKEISATIGTIVKMNHEHAKLEAASGQFEFKTSLHEKKLEYCQNVPFILPLDGKYETEISYTVSSKLLNDPRTLTDFDSTRVILSDRSDLNVQDSLWAAECAGKICVPKLSFNSVISFNKPKDNPYIIGSSKTESITITVTNTGEVAYDPCVRMHIVGANVLKPGGCVYETLTDDGDRLKCEPSKPIRTNEKWSTDTILVEMTHLTNQHNSISITMVLHNRCNNPNDTQNFSISIPVKADPQGIAATGETDIGSIVKMSEEDIKVNGKMFKHVYTITNSGPTNWVGLPVEVTLVLEPFVKYEEVPVTVYFSTSNQYVPCKSIIDKDTSTTKSYLCTVDSLMAQLELAKILIPMHILPGTLDGLLEKDNNVTIMSSVKVEPINGLVREESVTSTITLQDAAVPFETIIIAVVIGLCILIVIALILYRIGFLRRKRREELQKLQKSVKRQTILRRSTMPSQSSARGSAEDRKQILEGMKEEEEHSPNLI